MNDNLNFTSYEAISKAYFDLANHTLTPAIAQGLVEGLEVYRKATKNGKAKNTNISVEMDTSKGVMSLYYGENKCEGKPFFIYELGESLIKCAEMLEKMEEMGGGYSYDQAVTNWFSDAKIDSSAYKDLTLTLWIPETNGDLLLENIASQNKPSPKKDNNKSTAGDIITEKDFVAKKRGFDVNKPIEVFCGLILEKSRISFYETSHTNKETLTLSDALSKINEYIQRIQTDKNLSEQIGKEKPIKIIQGYISLDINHIGTSFFSISIDNEKTARVDIKIQDCEIVSMDFYKW